MPHNMNPIMENKIIQIYDFHLTLSQSISQFESFISSFVVNQKKKTFSSAHLLLVYFIKTIFM